MRKKTRKDAPKKLLSEKVDEDEEGSVSNGLGELELSLLGDVQSLEIFLLLVELGVLVLLPGSGNEDLVSSNVSGGRVMSTVRDPPRVVWDSKSRVKNPSDSVVDGLKSGRGRKGREVRRVRERRRVGRDGTDLRGREGLMSTLVSDDPETSGDETSPEPVDVPEGERESLRRTRREASGSLRLELRLALAKSP